MYTYITYMHTGFEAKKVAQMAHNHKYIYALDIFMIKVMAHQMAQAFQ